MVKAIDPTARTMTLHVRGLDKTFQIASDCNVLLRDDKPGRLADIQTGNHVTVTYETPDGQADGAADRADEHRIHRHADGD